MRDLFETLQAIKKRPALYLGRVSIFCLESFLFGYFCRGDNFNLPPTSQEKEFTEFTKWIRQKYSVKSTEGWARIIFARSEDEKDALDRFFYLLEEFQNQKIK